MKWEEVKKIMKEHEYERIFKKNDEMIIREDEVR
jgi:hypothetical protein